MIKNNKSKNGKQDFQANNDIPEKNESKAPLFPFDKMVYQEKGENENDIHEYDMRSDQELNLGESESRTKKRTLRDEKDTEHT